MELKLAWEFAFAFVKVWLTFTKEGTIGYCNREGQAAIPLGYFGQWLGLCFANAGQWLCSLKGIAGQYIKDFILGF